MEVFKDHRRFIFQSKSKDHKNTIEILDLNKRFLVYCNHKHRWKTPDGPFKINKQARATDIYLESFDKKFLGEINEIHPQLFSMRRIRKFEIYDQNKILVGTVREKPKFIGSDWQLEKTNNETIAFMVGNRKKKTYKIQSPGGQVLPKSYRDP